GGVHRAGPGPAPVLHGHPGAPGAEEPAHAAASAVRRVRPGRRRVRRGRRAPGRSGRAPGCGLVSAFTHETLSRTPRYSGPVFSVYTDKVTMSGGGTAERDVTENKGAVGVAAVDDVGRVGLVRQYRHPVHRRLWELPAGLRDGDGAGRPI